MYRSSYCGRAALATSGTDPCMHRPWEREHAPPTQRTGCQPRGLVVLRLTEPVPLLPMLGVKFSKAPGEAELEAKEKKKKQKKVRINPPGGQDHMQSSHS